MYVVQTGVVQDVTEATAVAVGLGGIERVVPAQTA